jgi:hypothetical protein
MARLSTILFLCALSMFGWSQTVQTGKHFYAIQNLETGEIILRGLTGFRGVSHPPNSLFLGPNRSYRHWVLQARTLNVGYMDFTTPVSGRRFRLGDTLLGSPDSLDTDGDGLHDQGEMIIGTDPNNPDTDGDGVQDGSEVLQNGNPLDGISAGTGVVGTIRRVPGLAIDVEALNDLAVLINDRGFAYFYNVFNGLEPRLAGRVSLPDDGLALHLDGTEMAVAVGSAGLAVVDFSNVARPEVRHEINLGEYAQTVLAFCGQALVGTFEGTLHRIDMETGSTLESMDDFGGEVQDLDLYEDHLYVLSASELRIYDLALSGFNLRSTLALSGSTPPLEVGRKLFVGGGYAYFGYFRGFQVIDVNDVDNPVVVGVPDGTQDAIHKIASTGSGRTLASTSFAGSNTLVFTQFDGSDPTDVTAILNSFDTPGQTRGFAVYNGLAYAADGSSGMQVINYQSGDIAGLAPSVSLALNQDGQAVEGSILRMTARAVDDVQVRNVAFFIDEVQVATDGNFPFEYRLKVPNFLGGRQLSLTARALDTGGNSSWSDELLLQIQPDNSTPPAIVDNQPADGATLEALSTLSATFNKSMDNDTIDTSSWSVVSAGLDQTFDTADDQILVPDRVEVFSDPFRLDAIFDAGLAAGLYRAEITQTTQDFASTSLAAPFQWTFTINAPAVTANEPLAGVTLPFLDEIAVVFSKAVNGSTVTNTSFTLEEAGVDGVFDTADDTLISDGVAAYFPETLRAVRRFTGGLRQGLYRATATTQITDDGGSPIQAVHSWTFTVTAPEVVAFTPAQGSSQDTLTQVTAEFSVAMDATTIDADHFTLIEQGPDEVFGTADDHVLIPDSIAVVNSGTSARLFFNTSIPSGQFQARLAADVRDNDGQKLGEDFTWTFTVNPAQVTANFPLDLDVVEAQNFVRATFDKPIDLASLNATTMEVREAGDDDTFETADDVIVSDGDFSFNNLQARRDFPSGLPSGDYRVTLTTGITDTLGHPIAAPYSWTFVNSGGTSITGTAQFNDGSPAVGAQVTMDSVFIGKRNTTTDANGNFTLSGITTTGIQIIRVDIELEQSGTTYRGAVDLTEFVLDGATQAGIVVIEPFCDARFDGGVFPFEQGLNAPVAALTTFDDGSGEALFIGGRFDQAAGQTVNYVVKWQNGVYTPLGSGFDDFVNALAVHDDGNGAALYAAGRFRNSNGTSLDRIARWDGSQWQPLAGGLGGWVNVLYSFDDGNGPALYAGGFFTQADGQNASRIARWRNNAWEALGDGLDAPVYAMTRHDDGGGADLYVGGSFFTSGAATVPFVARFNGTGFESLDNGLGNTVRALASFDDGNGPELYAGGDFGNDGNGNPVLAIARFDGTQWNSLGNGVTGQGGHKRHGKTPFGDNGQVAAMTVFDGGSGPALYVTGTFTFAGSRSAAHIARWQHGNWWTVGNGITGEPNNPFDDPYFGTSFTVIGAQGKAPQLYLGGPFSAVSFQSSDYLARITCSTSSSKRSSQDR